MRPVAAHEVKIRAGYGAPKHGTEVVDFRAASPFIDEEFNAEWQMFTPREEGAACAASNLVNSSWGTRSSATSSNVVRSGRRRSAREKSGDSVVLLRPVAGNGHR